MAVAPDLLLSAAADVRPKAAPKAPAATPEAAPGKASSFAKVLAGERQAEAASARRAEGRANAEKAQVDQQRQKSGMVEAADESAIAEDGKSLPAEEDAESVLDPLLLLGLGVEPGVAEEEAPDGGQEELAMVAAAALPISTSVIAAEGESPDGDAAVSLALDRKAASQPSAPAALALAEAAKDGDQAGEQAADAQSEPELDPEALTGKSTERLPEAASEPVVENKSLDVRLNTLAQAVNQAAPGQRAMLAGQPVAMNQSGWSEAVVDRVMLLSSQNLKSAEIQLDPAELGRLDVRVSLTQDQTLVSFSSPHAGVREALESQMYRMRELFAQQGMGQVDVNVSDQSLARNFDGQRGERDGSGGGTGGLAALDGDEHSIEESVPRAVTGRGLVDYYA